MTQEHIVVVLRLLYQFGVDVPISTIAQYAEDEFMIPYRTAVRILYDAA